MKRYEKLSKYKGIKKDLKNGNFIAIKYLNTKQYSKTFENLRDAINWRANFHPSNSVVAPVEKVEEEIVKLIRPVNFKPNGEDLGYRFKDLWDLYTSVYLPSLEGSSIEHRLSKKNFVNALMPYKMIEINANLIDTFMSEHKKFAIATNSKRHNFNDDLKVLKSILNWYRENYDGLYSNPILPRHKQAGIIKKTEKKNKKLKPEELILFFNALAPFWRDFAETQFYMGARVSEVAGLQASSIDLKNSEIRVQHVIVWAYKTKRYEYLKPYTKNGEISYASMNKRLIEIMKRRLADSANGFIFHKNGDPLTYRQIQYHYNVALKKAGLGDKFSSTHIMRHSMGTITRRVTGSIDMAQAVTRHKDIQVAQQYSSLPTEANKKAVNDVCDFLDELENKVVV